jgi:hypothetical protein
MAQYQFLGFSKLRKFRMVDLLFMAQYQFLGFSKLRKFRMVDQGASGSVNGVNMAGCPVLDNFPAARVFPAFWACVVCPAGLLGRWAWLGCVAPRTVEWPAFFIIFI